MLAHLQRRNRERQRETDPEAACHIDEFGVVCCLGGHHHRFECHAADWTRAWTGLPNFGMHRAGIDGAVGHWLGRLRSVLKITLRISDELFATAGGAEIIRSSPMLGTMGRRVRVHCHAADEILHEMRCAGRTIEHNHVG